MSECEHKDYNKEKYEEEMKEFEKNLDFYIKTGMTKDIFYILVKEYQLIRLSKGFNKIGEDIKELEKKMKEK